MALRIVLAIDGIAGDRLAIDAYDAGHDVVGRVSGAIPLELELAAGRADVVLAAAHPDVLTEPVVRAADDNRVRIVAVHMGEEGRRHARSLGILDSIGEEAPWPEVETLVLRPAGGGDPGRARSGPGGVGADAPAGRLDVEAPEGTSAASTAAAASTPAAAAPAAIPAEPEAHRRPGADGRPVPEPPVRAPLPSGQPFDGAQEPDHSAAPRFRRRRRAEAEETGAATPDGRAGRAGDRFGRAGEPTPVAPVSPGVADDAAPASVPSGRVIAVWGPAGAPGRSTVAVGIAAELAARGRRVLLADADTYGGTIAPALGLLDEAPGFAAACRLAGNGALTTAEIDRIAQFHGTTGTGFAVLTGISRPTRWPEISNDRVEGALEVCSEWADDVVIDVGFNLESDEEIVSDLFAPRRNAATLAVLGRADRIVSVGAADPLGMSRFLRAHAELVELVGDTPVTVVLNRVRSSAVGPSPHAQAAAALRRFAGIETARMLPHDLAAADAAVLTATTIRAAAARSPLAVALSQLVSAEFLPLETRAARRRRAGRAGRTGPAAGGEPGLLARLLQRRGSTAFGSEANA